MKLMFASDIHGSAFYCREMLTAYKKEQADRLILLGDILYHGPRNELPREYQPKEVIRMLNDTKQEILAIRGNCDSEVDQMVLDFPMLADYACLWADGLTIYATHGHIYNEQNLLPLKAHDILIHGHTHIPGALQQDGVVILNPGSVALPKENNVPSYGILEDRRFTVKDFAGEVVTTVDIERQSEQHGK